MLKNGNREKVTVNSSLYAKNIYEKFGFEPVSGVKERNGVTSIAIEYKLLANKALKRDEQKAIAFCRPLA